MAAFPSFSDIESPPPLFEEISLDIGSKDQKKHASGVIYKKDQTPSVQAKVVALVNQEPITMRDLIDRMRMVAKAPLDQMPDSQFIQMRQQVLNLMINEAIKRQTTERVGLKVSQAEIDEAIEQIEKQNKLSKGGLAKLLASKNIPLKILINSIKADIAWRNYVGVMAGTALNVDKKDLKLLLREGQGKVHLNLAEIVLYKSQFENDYDKTLEKLSEVMEEMNSGKTFVDTAFQYSHAPSGSRGGLIGWVDLEALDQEDQEALKGLNAEQATNPIKFDEGYKIYFIIDKKTKNVGKVDTITARQLEVKLDMKTAESAELRKKEEDKLSRLVETVSKCEEFDQLPDQIPNAQIHVYKSVQPSDLSPDLQNVFGTLDVGKPSKAIFNKANATIVFFLICERSKKNPQELKHSEGIANQISSRRFMAISEQKLLEAKRMASIELRI